MCQAVQQTAAQLLYIKSTSLVPQQKQETRVIYAEMNCLVSCADKWGKVHPHRQDIIRVGVHIHSQGKLHIWCLNIVNSGAVYCLYNGPNLWEWQMDGESWNLKRNNCLVVIYNMTSSMTGYVTVLSDSTYQLFLQSHPFQSYPVVSQQALQLMAVPLSNVLTPVHLQFG